MATIGTNTVRLAQFTAVAALNQVGGDECIVGAPAITATGRMFTLGLRGHTITPVSIKLLIPQQDLPIGRLLSDGKARGLYGLEGSLSRNW